MKTLILLIGCFLSLFSCSLNNGKEDWQKLGENAVGIHLYDRSSIKPVKPGVVKVWSKIIYSQRAAEQAAKAIPDAAGLYQQVSLDVIDCKDNQYIMSRAIFYDKHGKVLRDTGEDKKGLGYRPIPEDTPIERLAEAVCKMGKDR